MANSEAALSWLAVVAQVAHAQRLSRRGERAGAVVRSFGASECESTSVCTVSVRRQMSLLLDFGWCGTLRALLCVVSTESTVPYKVQFSYSTHYRHNQNSLFTFSQ